MEQESGSVDLGQNLKNGGVDGVEGSGGCGPLLRVPYRITQYIPFTPSIPHTLNSIEK
jgi:hypothetical protein